MELQTSPPQKLSQITITTTERITTGFSEMDTVLGGGIVKGAAMLLAGDPGVGKSTLALQLAMNLAGRGAKGTTILYVSGEESVEQIKMRADRLMANSLGQIDKKPGKYNPASDNLFLLSMTDPDAVLEQINSLRPALVVVDSIQTMQSANVAGLSGSVAQVRYSALRFIQYAKIQQTPFILIGHVTKEGMVAGPMVLTHMVDTVLFLEGEKFTKTRMLRSFKNRFGPVDEVGIFMMEEEGMKEIKNPQDLFLTDYKEAVPGSILVATLEGTRAFLVELQALVVYSKFPMPRRVVSGIDARRVELLLAVLQKHARLPLDTMDVFVNVAGGVKLADPGIDLGICLAVYSSLKNVALSKTVGVAEVGLLGELRGVSGIDKRIREAKQLGFNQIITAETHKRLADVIESVNRKGK